MTLDDLRNRFSYHPADTDEKVRAHEDVRAMCLEVAEHLNLLLPESREKERAVDALDDAMKHANAAIARHSLGGQPMVAGTDDPQGGAC